MSGWIKIEKDLETDPRVLRMAKSLAANFGLQSRDGCNACALPGVTLVCGALSRLWMYADAHARADDTMDSSAAELDDWLGIPGFCALLPADWLRVIDSDTVELPGYQEHNGVEAKKRALTQKRVAQHRDKEKRNGAADCNASALPDQTKTRPRPRPEEKTVAGLDMAAWESWKAYRHSIRKPIKPPSVALAQKQLAAYGHSQMAVVEQSIGQGWTGLFELKALNGKSAKSAPDNSAAWSEAHARAAAIGFRAPWPQESSGAYMTEIKQAESAPRSGPKSAAALAEKMRVAS